MASADALAFSYSPHELERAARHGSERLPSNRRRSPRRLPITTQALTKAIRSRSTSPHGLFEPAIRPQLCEDATSDRPSRKPDNNEDAQHISQSSYTLSSADRPDVPLNLIKTASSRAAYKSIPQKRARPLHDVDGPGTDTSSCKKRRLRRHLVTSRLSQPFSLPATHIHNRENGDDNTPCITRFLKAAATGAKRAGHESAMVRKAAILNSVRLKARQAAISRGHAELAELAARNTFFKHGQQVVTAPTISTAGTRYPVSEGMPGHQRLPVGWRPHTTIGPAHAAITASAPPTRASVIGSDRVGPHAQPPRQMPSSPKDSSPAPVVCQYLQDSEDDEGYGMAFPASDLDSRYADLSDDDMDDVYADFSAIFGPRPSQDDAERAASPHGEPGENDHFYEEYLDELDGIPWMS